VNTTRILASMTMTDGVERAADGTPTAFRIWKAGSNATDYGDHLFTERSARALLEEQKDRGNLYSIDVDHLSLSEEAPPESRKAVGWHQLAVRNGELWAVNVVWTSLVRPGLTSDPPEWRYFSPAYDVDKSTLEIVGYLNTALTNNPATHAVTALAAPRGLPGPTARVQIAATRHAAAEDGAIRTRRLPEKDHADLSSRFGRTKPEHIRFERNSLILPQISKAEARAFMELRDMEERGELPRQVRAARLPAKEHQELRERMAHRVIPRRPHWEGNKLVLPTSCSKEQAREILAEHAKRSGQTVEPTSRAAMAAIRANVAKFSGK
jgi:Mu-like prophage I protein